MSDSPGPAARIAAAKRCLAASTVSESSSGLCGAAAQHERRAQIDAEPGAQLRQRVIAPQPLAGLALQLADQPALAHPDQRAIPPR